VHGHIGHCPAHVEDLKVLAGGTSFSSLPSCLFHSPIRNHRGSVQWMPSTLTDAIRGFWFLLGSITASGLPWKAKAMPIYAECQRVKRPLLTVCGERVPVTFARAPVLSSSRSRLTREGHSRSYVETLAGPCSLSQRRRLSMVSSAGEKGNS